MALSLKSALAVLCIGFIIQSDTAYAGKVSTEILNEGPTELGRVLAEDQEVDADVHAIDAESVPDDTTELTARVAQEIAAPTSHSVTNLYDDRGDKYDEIFPKEEGRKSFDHDSGLKFP